MSNLPIPSPDADSPVVHLYREWCELERRVNGPMSDDDRDAIVVGELAPLEERLEAEPALDARDVAIKLYVTVEYYEGRMADEIESLIETGTLPAAQSKPVETTDPLLELVRSYERTLAECNALPDDVEDPLTWKPFWIQLQNPPAATTHEGAVAALRLLHAEETTCGNPPFTAELIAAALAFFDAGRNPA